jgi:aminoglycoside phosphotransferase family enzyme/predicted kinase
MRGTGEQHDRQTESLAFLADPATHGLSSGAVERIDTHGAIVFLAGPRAYKMKRAVRYPYLDYSTLEKRRWACMREVELNRRTAPDLYLQALPITREGTGKLVLGGDGEPVEWVVVMARFDQDGLFDALAERGELTSELLTALADAVADFHEKAQHADMPGDRYARTMVKIAEESLQDLERRPDLFEPSAVERLGRGTRDLLKRHAGILARRAEGGFVRLCHGDLHLRNVCLWNGRPTIFDCIEFDDAYATGDVQYDLAFLLMDLIERNLVPAANLVLNRYLSRTTDFEGLAPLPLYLSMRAAIRAKVAAAAEGAQTTEDAAAAKRRQAREYLQAALQYLRLPRARLIAVGGLSGSGKTALARRLAPVVDVAPGAVHLRSDVIRKRLFGSDERARLPQQAYTAETSERVYTRMADQARRTLAVGRAVLVDAVFARPEERRAMAAVAGSLGVPFEGLWLEAPEAELIARVQARTGDASDADAAVVRKQLGYDLGTVTWRRVDGAPEPETVFETARRLLDQNTD